MKIYENATQVILGEGFGIDNNSIVCPNCGNENLHQKKIEVFEREEDSTTGLHVTTLDNSAIVDDKIDGNPSSRRQGLVVYFQCEHCDGQAMNEGRVEFSCRLVIYQHKGCTFMGMESV